MKIKYFKKAPSLKNKSVVGLVSKSHDTGSFVKVLGDLLGDALDSKVVKSLAKAAKAGGFKAESGGVFHTFLPGHGLFSVTLLGLDDSSFDSYLAAGVKIQRLCRSHGLSNVVLTGSLQETGAVDGLSLGLALEDYKFDAYSSKDPEDAPDLTIHLPSYPGSDVERIFSFAKGTHTARDLINLCPRDCDPAYLASVAKELAKVDGITCKVISAASLKKMGAEGILAVAAGSQHDALLVKLSYRPSGRPKRKVALVGKGVTFDSGGLSIKPSSGMERMKFDMGGAAAVIGAMQIISEIKPDCAVDAYVPAVENMISGEATKPGDVIKALNGKYVEILNTDAEGRLILADALCLAEQEGADVIVDAATLTGAVITALGNDVAGMYTRCDELSGIFQEAAASAGESYWRMPLVASYKNALKSKFADIKNISGSRGGGSIVAAQFLGHFVETDKWIHLDIAGTAFSETETSLNPCGGAGFGARSLALFVEKWSRYQAEGGLPT